MLNSLGQIIKLILNVQTRYRSVHLVQQRILTVSLTHAGLLRACQDRRRQAARGVFLSARFAVDLHADCQEDHLSHDQPQRQRVMELLSV